MTKHPNSHLVQATCATCGTTHTLRSTSESLTIETCSSCHPAYTGVQRETVSGSRIDRFNRRRSLAAA